MLFQMESANAESYSALNKPQYDMGCDFIRALNLSKGDKVLDMGCGTGELTKFIADIVGADGEVVGVDPDEARIKVAQEKFKDVQNLKFLKGDSVAGFPRDSDQHYDLHFSNHVFHWLKGDGKTVYQEKAHACLKPGGRIAILTWDWVKQGSKVGPKTSNVIEMLTVAEYRELFENVSLFTDVAIEKINHVVRFACFEDFAAWFKASTRMDLKKMDPEVLKDFKESQCCKGKTEDDGTFKLDMTALVRITGRKAAKTD